MLPPASGRSALSAMVRIVGEQAGDLVRPPATAERVVANLAQHVPRFARLVRQKTAEDATGRVTDA